MSQLINEKAILSRELNRGESCLHRNWHLHSLHCCWALLPLERVPTVLGMLNRVHYKLPRGTTASIVEMKSKWHAMPNIKGFHMPDTESSRKAPEAKKQGKMIWSVCLGNNGKEARGRGRPSREAACRAPQRPGRGEMCRNSRDAVIQDTREDLHSTCCSGHWVSPVGFHKLSLPNWSISLLCQMLRNHWTPELFPTDLFLS